MHLVERRCLPEELFVGGFVGLHHVAGDDGPLIAGGVPVEEVVDPIDRNRGLHRSLGAFKSGLILRPVGGQGSQRGEMPTGRATADGNERRIDTAFRPFLSHPDKSSFQRNQLIGEGGLRHERI